MQMANQDVALEGCEVGCVNACICLHAMSLLTGCSLTCRTDASHFNLRLPLADILNQADQSRLRSMQQRHSASSAHEQRHPAQRTCITAGTAATAGITAGMTASTAALDRSNPTQLAGMSIANAAGCSKTRHRPETTPANGLTAQAVASSVSNEAQDSFASAASTRPSSYSLSMQVQPPTSVRNPAADVSASGLAPAETASISASRPAASIDNSSKAWSADSGLGMPLTKAVVQCSGTGCEDVLQMSKERRQLSGRVKQRETWVSRSFRGKAQSSCTLQLLQKVQCSVSIKVGSLQHPSPMLWLWAVSNITLNTCLLQSGLNKHWVQKKGYKSCQC